MRVIYFGHFWRSYGGTEFDLRTMLGQLVKRGFECMAITYDLSSNPGTPLLPVEVEGVQCLRSDYDTLLGKFNVVPNMPKWVFQNHALKVLRNNIRQGDILLTVFTPEKEAWTIAKAAGAKVVQKYTVIIDQFKDDDWSQVDGHVFNSKCCERRMRRVAPIKGPSAIIYPEIDIVTEDLWDPDGAIGMVNPALHKGVHIFWDLASKFPDEKFISAGGWAVDGPVTGPPNHTYYKHMPDMREFYKKLKLLLCPTQSNHIETFGRVVLEAMKYGIPVMASHKDGIVEASGEGARLIRAYSSNLLWAKALNDILRPQTLSEYHTKAIKRAKQYDIKRIMDTWHGFLEFVGEQ